MGIRVGTSGSLEKWLRGKGILVKRENWFPLVPSWLLDGVPQKKLDYS
jgi:hypothetical protein